MAASERSGLRDKLDALVAEGRWRLVGVTTPFQGIAASRACQGHTARVLVFVAAWPAMPRESGSPRPGPLGGGLTP